MTRSVALMFALTLLASTQAYAETSYTFCFGGGRAGLYYSSVYPVAHGTSDVAMAKEFSAFVKAKYGVMIYSQCHSNGTRASGESAKKGWEDSDQKSKYPSKLIETGWARK